MNNNLKAGLGILVTLVVLLLGFFFVDDIREALSGASPAVIDPASIGFGGMNRTQNGFNLSQNWRRFGDNVTRVVKVGGWNMEVVPWMSRGDQCLLFQDANGLHACQNTGAPFASASLSNETFCMVTDEASQVALVDAFFSQNGTRLDNWVNTISALSSCGVANNLTDWVTGVRYLGSGNWELNCSQVSDSASDADAHFISALAVINNSEYANSSTRSRAGVMLGKMCYGFARNNFLPYNITSKINRGENISFLPCGGTNVCTSPSSGSFHYTAYNGPMLEALAACNAYLGDNSSVNYTKLADSVVQAHLQASNWTGAVFSVGHGRQYHWANFTGTGTAHAICDNSCSFTDDPDAMRAPRICNGAAVWRDLRNVTLRNISTYCQQWHNLVGETGTTHTIERYFDGSAKSSTTDGGYKAVGLGAFMNSMVNTSLADNRIDQYNSHLGWSGTRGTMDSQACFGVYDKAFGPMALGFLIGIEDDAWMGNSNISGGGGGSSATSNITIANAAINGTAIDIGGAIRLNVSVNTTNGDIRTVQAQVLYPSGARQNHTMTRITNITEVAGSGSTTTYTCSFASSACDFTGGTFDTVLDQYNISAVGDDIILADVVDLNNYTNYYLTWNMSLVSGLQSPLKFFYKTSCSSNTGQRWIFVNESSTTYKAQHEGDYSPEITGLLYGHEYQFRIEVANSSSLTSLYAYNNTGGLFGSVTGESYTANDNDCLRTEVNTNAGGFISYFSVINPNATGINTTNVTMNTSRFDLNFTDTSLGGAYQFERIWANSSTGDRNNKTVLLNFTVSSNSSTVIAWSQDIGNVSQNHNLTLYRDANATNQSSSSCLVQPQGYNINSSLVFNNTHRFNDGLIVNQSHVNTSGEFGNAFSFDGVNDYLNDGNRSELQITANMTLMAWVRLSALPTTMGRTYHIVSKEQGNISGYSLWVWHSDDSPHCTAWGLLAPGQTGSSANVPLNAWTHIACRYNGTHFTSYMNCVPQITQETNGSILASDVSLNVGQRPDGEEDFNGSIDEVRVWKRSLSDAELCAEMSSRRPVVASDLLVSYSFEEYNTTHVYDTEHVTNYTLGYFDNRTGQFEYSPNISKTGFTRLHITATDTCGNVIGQNISVNISNTRPTNASPQIAGSLIAGSTLYAYCTVTDPDNDELVVNWSIKVNTTGAVSNGSIKFYRSGSVVNVANFTSSVATNYTLLCSVNDTLLESTSVNVTFGPVLSSGNGTVVVRTCQNISIVFWNVNATYYNVTTRRLVAPQSTQFYPVNMSACNFVYNLTLNATSNISQILMAYTNYSISNSSMTCGNVTLNTAPKAITTFYTNQSVVVNCSLNFTNTPVFNVSLRNIGINWSVV